MKRTLSFAVAALSAAACSDGPVAPAPALDLPTAAGYVEGTGNGAPQGAHDYQLMIIAHPNEINDGTDDDWGGEGRRIHVPIEGKTKILLFEGDYAVLDANATDGEGSFQLPAPGLDAYLVGDPGTADVWSAYSIFARALGKPGGWATITTCAELLDSEFGGLLPGSLVSILNRAEDDAYCSIEQVSLYRDYGKSKFENVTRELTTIVFEVTVDLDADGIADDTVQIRVPIFDPILEGEYWEYDNHGLRVAQIRFYDCSTNVETGESTCFPD